MHYLHGLYLHCRDIFELMYFLSAPAVACLAWYGLRQIKVTRDVSKTQSKRDAYKTTMERIDYFMANIFPKGDEFLNKQRAGAYPNLANVKVVEESDKIQITTEHMDAIIAETIKKDSNIVNLSNALESFAMCFTCGIGDERIAYRPMAHVYCAIIKELLPFLVFNNSNDGTFAHSLKLYMLWRNRLIQENNIKKMNELQKTKFEVRDIKPIGCD